MSNFIHRNRTFVTSVLFFFTAMFVTSDASSQQYNKNEQTSLNFRPFARWFYTSSAGSGNFVLQGYQLSNSLVHTASAFRVTPSNVVFSDTTKPHVKDRDKDGIPDSADKCPDEKGVIEYDGCPVPDSDNDGVSDDADDCPTIAGLIKYHGCPAPDRDGDKINDEDDKCPDAPGVARYDGCPVKDSDNDGVNDDDDKCKDVPGTIKNNGCPEKKPADNAAFKKVKTHNLKQKKLLK